MDKLKSRGSFLLFLVLLTAITLSGQVNTEKFRKDGEKDGISIACSLGMALHKGNTDLFRINGDININYFKGNNYLFLIGHLAQGEKNGEKYLNKGFAHLRGIHRFSKRLMAEVFTQEEFNKFILLKRRFLIGGGLRVLLFKQEKGNHGIAFNAGVGLMWEKELFNHPNGEFRKEDTRMVKSTNYLSIDWKLSETVNFQTVSYIQFNVGKEKSTRLTTDVTFDVKLVKALSYYASFHYRHDSTPPLLVKNYDIYITNGITLTF